MENGMKLKKKEEDEESDFKYKLSVFFFLEAMYTTNPSPCSWRLYNCSSTP